MPIQIKRTLTPNNPPTGLADGQLACEIATDPPNLWIGVPTSINAQGRILLNPATAPGGAGINDVIGAGTFLRQQGAWVPFDPGSLAAGGLTLGADTPPSNPVDGHIWTNKCGELFVWRPTPGDWVQIR